MASSLGFLTSASSGAQAAAPVNFVYQHKCRRWESLISVAVQYCADTTAIRVLNNLTTDHSLRSREIVYVPGMSLAPYFFI